MKTLIKFVPGSSGIDKTLNLLALGAVAGAVLSIAFAVYAQPAPRPTYKVGDQFNLANVEFVNGQPHLIIFVNTQCGACDLSGPLYRELAKSPGRTRVVVLGEEPRVHLEQFAERHGLHSSLIASIPRAAHIFRVTPTLLFLEPDRSISRVWHGLLDPIQAAEVLSIIQTGSKGLPGDTGAATTKRR